MNRRIFGGSLPLVGYACFVAALFLFVKGYQFNTDDQAEHLPQIYQMLDSDLYPNDYFVNTSNSIFTVRCFYEQFVLVIAKAVGLEWGLFVLTFLCIALMAYSFSRIAEEFFQDRWAVILAPIFAMLVFYNFTVGGNHIMYGSFISSTVAKGIAAFGSLQFIRSKYLVSGLFLGLATLFQPLVGLQLFLIFSAIELLLKRKWKNTLLLSVSYLIIASFVLIPVFVRQFSEGIEYNNEFYYNILYRFRNHHHYLPGLFPVTHYLKFGGLLFLGLFSYWFAKPNDRNFFSAFVGFGLFGMLIYVLGSEFLGIHQLGKTQWFKTTVWIEALSSIMSAGVLGSLFSGLLSNINIRRLLLPFSIVGSVVLLFGITNSKHLSPKYQHKYIIGNRVLSDLEKMHFWIEENTEKDISVLVSPDNNSFSCQAKRSMPIHYQAIIHEPFFMLPWYDNYKEIYGVSVENLEGADARKHAADLYGIINYRGAGKHIDYRLDNLETCHFSSELGPILHQEGKWVLTKFLPS